MKHIPLTQGKSTLVDDGDFEYLSQFKWLAARRKNTFYAVRIFGSKKNRTTLLMHRVIVGCVDGHEVDHRDGDGLNNRRENLRIATHSQNMGNSRRRKDNTSGFKGVSFHRERKKWTAHIVINKRSTYLGLFLTPEEAHDAYCAAAQKQHGEFARAR